MNLNLAYPEKSEIKFKINNYPDGQSDVLLTDDFNGFDVRNQVMIKSRFNSFKDLELIICATKALNGIGVKEIILFIPYILGARSDRKFSQYGVSYLRDVIAPIINAQNYVSVIVLDPHSDVVEAVINNLYKTNNINLVDFALDDIWDGEIESHEFYTNKTVLVSPDAGALKKIYDVAKEFNCKNVIVASKHRDISTGNILSTEVPNLIENQGKDFVIIDDICDGGRTFIEIAKKIKQELPDGRCGKIYLIVTHGIFSAGFTELQKYFDAVYTTNSIKDNDFFDWSSNTFNNTLTNFCKQLNVF